MRLTMKAILAGVLILAGAAASESALAGRSSVSLGFSFGFPGYGYYPAPYYYPPAYPYYTPYYAPYYYPSYGYPEAPTTYVEQGAQPVPAQPPTQWWYYCAEAKAYYPYVRECAGSWQRVSPTPPPG
jgi:hypothetical protein